MATEHLIKAIYLRNTQRTEMPPTMRTAASHDLAFIAAEAGLSQEIAVLKGVKRRYWLTVRDWDQGKRYPNDPFPSREGKDLKIALFNVSNGIWPWLSNHYQQN